jgi:hypothetical protein
MVWVRWKLPRTQRVRKGGIMTIILTTIPVTTGGGTIMVANEETKGMDTARIEEDVITEEAEVALAEAVVVAVVVEAMEEVIIATTVFLTMILVRFMVATNGGNVS